MTIIPAIDLKNQQCVRLKRGVAKDITVFSDNPCAVAKHWVEQGAKRLHLIDLDGAFTGKPTNATNISAIAKKFPNLLIQIGGGIRTIKTATAYIKAGADYLIIGTMAITNPEFIKELCRKFPNKIIIGLDANNGLVATNGWTKQTDLHIIDLAKKFEQCGINSIIYTDIAKDGMLEGVNAEATANLAKQISIPVIASGGISSVDDILKILKIKHHGVIGAIIGSAFYKNILDFKQTQKICDNY